MSQFQLDNNAIQYVRDAVLDEDDQSRSHAFLYRYYTQKYKQPGTLIRPNLLQDLSNMEFEVQQDQSSNYGGWQTHVDTWNNGTGTYPKLRRNLLVPPSTDLDLLIEGHHIAVTESHAEFEFATANPSDFIKHYPKEPCSREVDICNRTAFCNIRDLADSLDRHFPN